MKQNFLILGVLFFSVVGHTQEVVASSGNYDEGSTASLSWTLGEVITETFEGTNAHLTQGEQQTLMDKIATVETHSDISLSIFPNPTNDFFIVKSSTVDLSMTVTDSRDRIVITRTIYANSDYTVDVNNLEAGIYYLNFTGTNFQSKTHKIIKL